jgi:hypothetical protein
MDERGTIWAIGPASGEWYFRDEDDWIMGEPNTLLTQIEKNEEYISDTKSDKPVLDLRNPIIKELLKKM